MRRLECKTKNRKEEGEEEGEGEEKFHRKCGIFYDFSESRAELEIQSTGTNRLYGKICRYEKNCFYLFRSRTLKFHWLRQFSQWSFGK